MGLTCYVCSLDSKVVKLGNIDVVDDRNGQIVTKSVCDHCRTLVIQHNHPINQNLQDAPPQQPGYIKPSTPGNYPPVRPQ